jgi:hypothetical protein
MKQIRQIGGRKGAQHAGYRKVLHGFARIEVTDAAVRPGSSETLVLQTNRERLQYLTSKLPWNLHHGPQGRAVRDSAGVGDGRTGGGLHFCSNMTSWGAAQEVSPNGPLDASQRQSRSCVRWTCLGSHS